ncbi:MAG: 4-hydroxy-tetrahydrodipicolinate synthase [Gammaproteobacteria bacterium]|nr:MAG: 4-hydroxy-tetrahydrodipicolinate synthase [Gammaproteobacteria bacterium]
MKISGSIVALVTPMHDDGSVDWEALAKLVSFHVANKTDAIVTVGTTGESATLDFDEHAEVIRFVVREAAGRIPVIAGTGANSTKEALMLTRSAAEAGADAALLVTPYYNKPTQEGLYQHYKLLADSVDIPQILYNVPGRTAVDMQNETVARLADHPRIAGIKDATGDVARGAELVRMLGDAMAVYSGDDGSCEQLMLAGGQGNISVTANVAPAKMAELCRLAMAGERAQAEALQASLQPLHSILFVESNPIPVKWALHEMGMIEAGIRLPLTPLSEALRPKLRETLVAQGLLSE